jgi:winged helix DNA-binding protein
LPASSIHAVTQERLASQLLADSPARDPVAVTRRLLAVQGQDPRGARLTIRARSSGLSATDVDRALSEERSLLITWLNRGTLHLICSEDYAWLHALTTPRLLSANARRLQQEGVTSSAAERGVKAIERALADDGPLTRPQLRERIAAARVRTQGQALVHLLMLATLRGLTVRGPMVGREHAYARVADWLGPAGTKQVQRDAALAELARRYLAGHAPADERDLAKWSGLPLRDVRAGLGAIASELRERPDGLLELAKGARAGAAAAERIPPEPPPPRLLGAFDPLLLGWASRDPIVGANKSLVTINGLFRPFALVRGRAVASWKLARGEVVLEPFGRLARGDAAALHADAKDVLRYLSLSPSRTSASVKPS